VLQEIGKTKAFSTKTKTKEIFKGGSIKKITTIPPTKLFNNLKKSQINSQPWTYHIQINSLITTRPPSPKT
jgi:hypothetical protein